VLRRRTVRLQHGKYGQMRIYIWAFQPVKDAALQHCFLSSPSAPSARPRPGAEWLISSVPSVGIFLVQAYDGRQAGRRVRTAPSMERIDPLLVLHQCVQLPTKYTVESDRAGE